MKKNVADLKPEELKGKVVFVRADLNVPQVSEAGESPRRWRWRRRRRRLLPSDSSHSPSFPLPNPAASEQGDSGDHGRHAHPRQPAHAAVSGQEWRARGGDLPPGAPAWWQRCAPADHCGIEHVMEAPAKELLEAAMLDDSLPLGDSLPLPHAPHRTCTHLAVCRAAPRALRRRAAWHLLPSACLVRHLASAAMPAALTVTCTVACDSPCGAVPICSPTGTMHVLILFASPLPAPASDPAELLAQEVSLAPDCVGEEVKKMIAGLQDGQVLLLENVRWVGGGGGSAGCA